MVFFFQVQLCYLWLRCSQFTFSWVALRILIHFPIEIAPGQSSLGRCVLFLVVKWARTRKCRRTIRSHVSIRIKMSCSAEFFQTLTIFKSAFAFCCMFIGWPAHTGVHMPSDILFAKADPSAYATSVSTIILVVYCCITGPANVSRNVRGIINGIALRDFG